VKWRRSYNCRRSEADQVLVTGAAGTGGGVLRSTDRLVASTTSALGKSPVRKGVTFNLDNDDDDDDDDDDDKSISQPIRDACRYCTVSSAVSWQS